MRKTININKLSKAKRDAIIKVDGDIVAITKEIEMASKAPKWFTDWSQEFKKENDKRWERQEKFNELLMSLPTIKKEIEELK